MLILSPEKNISSFTHKSTFHMDALTQRALDRIDSRTQFNNETVKGLVLDHPKKSFALAAASAKVTEKASALGLDPEQVTDAVNGIAQSFGELEPSQPSEQRKNAIKGFMKDLIDEEDADLELAIEEYFNADYDLETSFNTINAGVNAELPGGQQV